MQQQGIVIIGGGPIGLITAISLAKSGLNVTVIDRQFSYNNDTRLIALSYASMQLFHELGIDFPARQLSVIKQVHLSHSGFGLSNISAQDVNLPELGYTIKYHDICFMLKTLAAKYAERITLKNALVTKIIPSHDYATIEYTNNDGADQITADLAIVAEGGNLNIAGIEYMKRDYNQTALIARLHIEKSSFNDNKQQGLAYERFDTSGALVLLPYMDDYMLIWSLPQSYAQEIVDQNNLILHLQQLAFFKRFGVVTLVGDMHHFPLKLQVANPRITKQVVLIGNAAHTVHPISAQGLNLGLRDAICLANLIAGNKNDYQVHEILQQFAKLRAKDSNFVIRFTDILSRFMHSQQPTTAAIASCTNELHIIDHSSNLLSKIPKPFISVLRTWGIFALGNCKPLRRMLSNSLIFGTIA